MGSSWALLGQSWAVLEACKAVLAAVLSFLGRLGSLGEPPGGAMAAQGPPGVGGMLGTLCVERGGGPLEDYRALGILPRLNVTTSGLHHEA